MPSPELSAHSQAPARGTQSARRRHSAPQASTLQQADPHGPGSPGTSRRDPSRQAGHVSLSVPRAAASGLGHAGSAWRWGRWAPRCVLALFPGAMLPTHLWPVGLSLLAILATLCWMADGGQLPEWMLARESTDGVEESVD